MKNHLIPRCYDSHVHWLETGRISDWLNLKNLQSVEEVFSLKTSLPEGHWVLGFGWDQNQWASQKWPHRSDLDRAFPHHPVVFFRADGHALWANTQALIQAGLPTDASLFSLTPEGGEILRDEAGGIQGVFIDRAMDLITPHLPQLQETQIQHFLIKAMRVFHQRGFTHIRDMSCSSEQWNEVVHLDESGLLLLAVEQWFDAEDPKDYKKALDLAIRARQQKGLLNVRPCGLKVFFDGALGSEGAFLSQPYKNSKDHRGICLMSNDFLQDILVTAWEQQVPVAVHCIGDEAVHQVALTALKVQEERQLKGTLHLEHVEMVRSETVPLLKRLSVSCYLQPCHWLTDKAFLEPKLGELKKWTFPWRLLQEHQVPFYFGSDSPIEEPSLKWTKKALEESAQNGWPPLMGDPFSFHSHPDESWASNSFTEIDENENVCRVVFRGQTLN
ncbi:MAG: hypothetical protein D6797_04255 [Bdellovibrio sp.]|nr:MAG: hypothetical protein D6797_04255 [Bdellovibrio sp.]